MVATGNHRHIPAEIVEEILLNLPVKSLVRFSSVSKLWESMISESGFVKRYRSRGRERMALERGEETIFKKASTCLASSISWKNPTVAGATDFVCPFGNHHYDEYYLVAGCGDLWLALANGRLLLLWNPSIRTFRKLPAPSIPLMGLNITRYIFGLGYDSVGDDYKVLKIARAAANRDELSAELYSLRNDSWRDIHDFPAKIDITGSCAFVSGKLHFVLERDYDSNLRPAIICFDLSTEEFGEVAPPNYWLRGWIGYDVNEGFRGMLSVSVYYRRSFHIWVMEEYGVAESWTRKFNVEYHNSIFGFKLEFVTPLYMFENGEILMKVDEGKEKCRMFVYKDKKTTPREVVMSEGGGSIGDSDADAFVYFDSLVLPYSRVKT